MPTNFLGPVESAREPLFPADFFGSAGQLRRSDSNFSRELVQVVNLEAMLQAYIWSYVASVYIWTGVLVRLSREELRRLPFGQLCPLQPKTAGFAGGELLVHRRDGDSESVGRDRIVAKSCPMRSSESTPIHFRFTSLDVGS